MALCDSSVLTGQEGSITFKPPGTSVCVRDFSAFGTDGTDSHITLACGADFRVGDVVTFTPEDGGNLDTALTAGTPRSVQNAIGAVTQFTLNSGGTTYVDAVYPAVALTGGVGTGATADITVAGGIVTSVVFVNRGSGYAVGDDLSATDANLGGGGSGAGLSINVDSVFQPAATGIAYYVVATGTDNDGNEWMEVSLAPNGSPISMNGDGGTGSADNELPAHINIRLADWFSVCGVREFSLDISRDELDVTTLPCADGGDEGCQRLAAFRSTQAGYASATGTMSVYFTCDQDNIANRLLGSSLLKSQGGATVRLYVCSQYKDGEIDNDSSLYVEAEISITGMSFSVNPDDPTVGELTFSVTKMIKAFGLQA